MVIRDRDRCGRFVSMARAYRKSFGERGRAVYRVRLPLVGVADVWCVDGRAICRPVGSRVVLVFDWVLLSAYCRRHRLGFWA